MSKLIQLLVIEEISRLEELSLEFDGTAAVSKFDDKIDKLKNNDVEAIKELIKFKMTEISGILKYLKKSIKDNEEELNSLQEEYFKLMGVDI